MPDRQLRVCHVIHSLGPGGAESLLLDLAAAAPRAGLELSVVSLMPTAGLHYPRRLAESGVAVASLNLPTRWDPRGLSRGLAALERARPDVVHTHLKHADLIGAFAVRRLRVPMISTLHLIEDAVGAVGRMKRRLAAQARIRGAVRTIAVSDALRRWYLASFKVDPSRVVTIRNGVVDRPPSAGTREALRRQLGIPADAVVVTMVAVMRPGKGHDDLIAALARLPQPLGMHVLLAGDGPLRAALEASVHAHGLPGDRVIFAGFREDVPAVLAAADIIAQPSRFEALPTALIQGLAAGLPAVATAVGGIPEILAGDAGILVPPAAPDALAAALAALAADPKRRDCLGAAARLRFEAEFEAGVWVRRLRALYDTAVSARPYTAGAEL